MKLRRRCDISDWSKITNKFRRNCDVAGTSKSGSRFRNFWLILYVADSSLIRRLPTLLLRKFKKLKPQLDLWQKILAGKDFIKGKIAVLFKNCISNTQGCLLYAGSNSPFQGRLECTTRIFHIFADGTPQRPHLTSLSGWKNVNRRGYVVSKKVYITYVFAAT